MAGTPWGKCSRCGKPLGSIMQRGPCSGCLAQDAAMQPEGLRRHPDLLAVERALEDWQKIWDEWGAEA